MALLAVLAGSCVTARDESGKGKATERDRGFKFSHELHRSAGMEDCSACHDVTAAHAAALSAPGHDLCSICHEIPESGTTPPEDPVEREKCAFCHTRPDYSVRRWQRVLSEELKWEHAPHLDAGLECAACHKTLDTNALTPGPMKPFCMDCHRQHPPQLNDCTVCHREMTQNAIPQFRKGQRIAHDSPEIWRKIHGREARVDANYCALCHETQNRCDDCHSSTPPDNHTAGFKNRTHGMIAAWERNTCATCHEERTCVQCHQEKRPVSHRAGWGGARNSHCVNCHYPPERTGCVVCHERIDHAAASPSPHTFGIYPPNCARCHPGGLPHLAPHLLNSTVHCVVCHL
jgi:hypothetical protein